MKFVEALAMGCVVTSISMVRTSPFADLDRAVFSERQRSNVSDDEAVIASG
jgi:dihydroorotase-like cyclic amidohydrolase